MFDELSVEQRRTFEKEKSLCFNCLKHGHVSRNCESKFICKFCHICHHSLLHADILNSQAAVTSTHSRDDKRHIPGAPEDATATISHIARAQVAPTAESLCNGSTTATQPQGLRKLHCQQLWCLIKTQQDRTCRVLLDSGSELSYISERCVQALGLVRSPSRILVTGISSILQSRISDTQQNYVHVGKTRYRRLCTQGVRWL